jgi:hypothetical protein
MEQEMQEEKATKTRTICLDIDAHAYLAKLFPTSRGSGAFLSRLVHEYRIRKELTPRQELSSQKSWRDTGLCVD